MFITGWQLWIVVAIILFIAEAFVPGFVLMCLGIGCLFAVVPAALDWGLKMQILLFSIGTLVGFFGARPVFTRYFYGKSKHVRTNVDALTGETGQVVEAIDEHGASGRVLVRGDNWRAVSDSGEPIPAGRKVRVTRVEGNKLFVQPL